MNRFPSCPECSSDLIETPKKLEDQSLVIKSLRCIHCEFEDDVLEQWPEGQYEYHFLGRHSLSVMQP